MSECSSDIQVVDLGRDYGSPNSHRQNARSPARSHIPRSAMPEFTIFSSSQVTGNLPYFDEASPSLSLHYGYSSSIEDWRFEERRDMSRFLDPSVEETLGETLETLDTLRGDAFNVHREVRQSSSGGIVSVSTSTLVKDAYSPLAYYLQMDGARDKLPSGVEEYDGSVESNRSTDRADNWEPNLEYSGDHGAEETMRFHEPFNAQDKERHLTPDFSFKFPLLTIQSPNKRRETADDDDHVDNAGNNVGHSSKRIKKEETSPVPTFEYPSVLLSGFYWDETVGPVIDDLIAPYGPVMMTISTEYAVAEREHIKSMYKINTDFVKIWLETAQNREDALELAYTRLGNGQHLMIQKALEEGEKSPSIGPKVESPEVTDPPMSNPVWSNHGTSRKCGIHVWVKLVNAVAAARSELQGDDLETFEKLIAKPKPGVGSMRVINDWAEKEGLN